jgi:flagellar motor protein MotB
MRAHAQTPERPPRTAPPQSRPSARPAVTNRPAATATRAEAGDRGVAPLVTQTTAPRLQRACACGGGCPACGPGRAERGLLQTKRAGDPAAAGADPAAAASTHAVEQVVGASGQPLDSGTRGFMESRFGHDFGGVRVHTDTAAAASARDVNSLAYTLGSHIVFDHGAYVPTTDSGRRLLAHELTHVVQQQRAGASPTPRPQTYEVSSPSDSAEVEAERVAEFVTSGAPAHATRPPGGAPRIDATPAAAIHRAPPAAGAAPASDQLDSSFTSGQSSPAPSAFIHFPTAVTTLDAEDIKVVGQVVKDAAARSDPNELDFEIDGFADERPVASDPKTGNQVLSEQRAAATRAELEKQIDALPPGLGKKALKRSTLKDKGQGVSPVGPATQAFERRAEIKIVVKPTLLDRGLINWKADEAERFTVKGAGVTPRKLAIEAYGDDALVPHISFLWDTTADGALTPDTEVPVGRWARIQYNDLRPSMKKKYDSAVSIAPRSSWGARPPIIGDPKRSYDPYTGPLETILNAVVVHHSGNSNMHTMKQVQDEHLDEKERADIAYHYGINLKGEVFEGRPINVKGAHVEKGNTGRIGIVLLADLDTETWEYGMGGGDDTLTPAMEASLLRLIHYLMGKYPLIDSLGGHLEFAAALGADRTCPGDLAMAKMSSWRSSTNLKKP